MTPALYSIAAPTEKPHSQINKNSKVLDRLRSISQQNPQNSGLVVDMQQVPVNKLDDVSKDRINREMEFAHNLALISKARRYGVAEAISKSKEEDRPFLQSLEGMDSKDLENYGENIQNNFIP